jgi:hypothetical protein
MTYMTERESRAALARELKATARAKAEAEADARLFTEYANTVLRDHTASILRLQAEAERRGLAVCVTEGAGVYVGIRPEFSLSVR